MSQGGIQNGENIPDRDAIAGLARSSGFDLISESLADSTSPLEWRCKRNHAFLASFLTFRSHGLICPACAENARHDPFELGMLSPSRRPRTAEPTDPSHDDLAQSSLLFEARVVDIAARSRCVYVTQLGYRLAMCRDALRSASEAAPALQAECNTTDDSEGHPACASSNTVVLSPSRLLSNAADTCQTLLQAWERLLRAYEAQRDAAGLYYFYSSDADWARLHLQHEYSEYNREVEEPAEMKAQNTFDEAYSEDIEDGVPDRVAREYASECAESARRAALSSNPELATWRSQLEQTSREYDEKKSLSDRFEALHDRSLADLRAAASAYIDARTALARRILAIPCLVDDSVASAVELAEDASKRLVKVFIGHVS